MIFSAVEEETGTEKTAETEIREFKADEAPEQEKKKKKSFLPVQAAVIVVSVGVICFVAGMSGRMSKTASTSSSAEALGGTVYSAETTAEKPQAETQTAPPSVTLPSKPVSVTQTPTTTRNVFYGVMGEFVTASEDYFDNVLFIGDSRMAGVQESGGVDNATIFAFVGASVYNIHSKQAYVNNGYGYMSLKSLLAARQFERVYISLGINEIGCAKGDIVARFASIINEVFAASPNACVIIIANIHMTANASANSAEGSNADLDTLNMMLAGLADGERIFYVDPNELLDDAYGNLNSSYSEDGIHLYSEYSAMYANWLKTKALI